MLKVLRADQAQSFSQGTFQIRRVRPGLVNGEGADPAFGPLNNFDHANLGVGTVVKMHEHNNDEILSYMWRGTMQHEDTAGHRISISANKLMMMNAGKSFWHEERTPDESVEMLQIFVRPREADLPALVNFYERPDGAPSEKWGFVAAPEGSAAPLTIRNEVRVYDVHLHEGSEIDVPAAEGMAPFLYVLDGAIEVGDQRLGKGDGISDDSGALPPVAALGDATLVLFLVNRSARASRAGTISGR